MSANKVSLRPATQDDLGRIKELVRSARINPMQLDWRRFVVAVAALEGLIGCGQVKRHRDGSSELASIVVEPAWRGRGVGRMIIEDLMSSADDQLWLTCRSGLVPLYEKFGFSEVDVEADLPPYFRRIRRLASTFSMFAGKDEHLAIMRLQEDRSGP